MSKSNILSDKKYLSILEEVNNYLSVGLSNYVELINFTIGINFDIESAYDGHYILKNRLHDVARAIAFDIYRYAGFHNIGCDENTNKPSVAESVFAAYAIKWICMLHPLTFDRIVIDDVIEVATTNIDESQGKYGFLKNRMLSLCNEYYAICVASRCITPDHSKTVINILDDMEQEEIDTLLYGMRYRIKHQDVYTSLMKRLAKEIEFKYSSK